MRVTIEGHLKQKVNGPCLWWGPFYLFVRKVGNVAHGLRTSFTDHVPLFLRTLLVILYTAFQNRFTHLLILFLAAIIIHILVHYATTYAPFM